MVKRKRKVCEKSQPTNRHRSPSSRQVRPNFSNEFEDSEEESSSPLKAPQAYNCQTTVKPDTVEISETEENGIVSVRKVSIVPLAKKVVKPVFADLKDGDLKIVERLVQNGRFFLSGRLVVDTSLEGKHMLFDFDKQNRVRMRTMARVSSILGLGTTEDLGAGKRIKFHCDDPPWNLQGSTYFKGRSELANLSWAKSSADRVLGQFDSISIPMIPDYNCAWDRIRQEDAAKVFVLYAPAVNLSSRCGFWHYSVNSSVGSYLDTKKYLNIMSQVIRNFCLASKALKIEHLVLVPFGMGAYLRDLPVRDDAYKNRLKFLGLKVQLAHNLISKLTKYCWGNTVMHFCLRTGDQEDTDNSRAILNALIAKVPANSPKVVIWKEADCLEVAIKLAKSSSSVTILNASNRHILGNKWWEDSAKRAVEENLHRRSSILSAAACVLNYHNYWNNPDNRLLSNVHHFNGRVVLLDEIADNHSKSRFERSF